MDFTISTYKRLLKTLLDSGYKFVPFKELLLSPQSGKVIVLRHDVDIYPQNSLLFAKIQRLLNVKGTYNFRSVPESWDERIIKEIHHLGHEIGYHYESLTTCKGDITRAIKDFENNLDKLRGLVPVETICMHGSPRSPYDSRDIWKKYDYRNFGILGEPYFDVDFNKVFYLTDTGRRWNGNKVSVRDKVNPQNTTFRELNLKHTKDIMKLADENKLPEQVMFTFHPQRWTNHFFPWMKELIWQNTKNIGKRYCFK